MSPNTHRALTSTRLFQEPSILPGWKNGWIRVPSILTGLFLPNCPHLPHSLPCASAEPSAPDRRSVHQRCVMWLSVIWRHKRRGHFLLPGLRMYFHCPCSPPPGRHTGEEGRKQIRVLALFSQRPKLLADLEVKQKVLKKLGMRKGFLPDCRFWGEKEGGTRESVCVSDPRAKSSPTSQRDWWGGEGRVREERQGPAATCGRRWAHTAPTGDGGSRKRKTQGRRVSVRPEITEAQR